MRRLLCACALLAFGAALGRMFAGVSPAVAAGGPRGGASPSGNGDVNGDGEIDVSDAVYLLANLFQGGPAVKPIECPPAPPTHNLPDTGQSNCYDQDGRKIPCDSETCQGQDGFYATGCSSEGRFVDNGDGTVSDNCTGLIWQQDTAVRDRNWCNALAYCEKLSFAGHDDWRLPNLRELESILDYGRYIPGIDQPSINPVFGSLMSWYWSSTSVEGSPDRVWNVGFGGGNRAGVPKDFGAGVRAVRSGP